MLRVGFVFRGGDGWLGGVNYLWNLLYAIGRHEGASLRPLLITSEDSELHGLDRLPGVEVARRKLRPEARGDQVARTIARRVIGVDRVLARLFDELGLDLVSHSGTYGWRFPVPTMTWIPDLQYWRLPEYFTALDQARRIYIDATGLIEGTSTVVSSEAAKADCRRYYGPLAARVDVLRFVSQPRIDPDRLPASGALQARLAVPARYFFLPNQFWRHKNHAVVVDALALLAARGVRPVVVATGKGEDYRAPEHYAALMRRVADGGLAEQFRHLGLVSAEDVAGLMHGSLAVINPSRFEGWSTTVEEARSLGKATLLSDIDVHREQAPPGAAYFSPDDPSALADLMARTWSSDPAAADRDRARAAANELEPRTAAFARRYRELAEATARRR
jgi:glycosyltransferase involved in cell wall biosynthesis